MMNGDYDVEAAMDSDGARQDQKVVSRLPGGQMPKGGLLRLGETLGRKGDADRHWSGHGLPVPRESGEEFLADEESLGGNEDMSSDSLAQTENAPDPEATNDNEAKVPSTIKRSTNGAVQCARRLFWIVWTTGTVAVTMSLLTVAKNNRKHQSTLDQDMIIILAMVAFAIVLGLSFLRFDRAVRSREVVLTRESETARNMMASFFPAQFHDRLLRLSSDEDLHESYRMQRSAEFERMVLEASTRFDIPLQGEDSSDSESRMSASDEEERLPPHPSELPHMPSLEESPAQTPKRQPNFQSPLAPVRRKSPVEETRLQRNHSRNNNEKTTNDERRERPRRKNSMDLTTRSEGGGKRFVLEPFMKSPSFRNLMGIRPDAGADVPMTPVTPRRPTLMTIGSSFRKISISSRGFGLEPSATPRPDTFNNESNIVSSDEPIADLFPNCTVLFADISGFTAWSSSREPTQVFKLLETIYRTFDRLARKRGVFKVETIGDCYLAVTGLPEPQQDHAVLMVAFAKECMSKLRVVTRELEITLGPETASLAMRFGLHSGPVTAGVLRGEKSRFQLFGDTVNIASRMESTGERNRVQVSQATADLLVMAGKQHWIQPREGLVDAKGLGQVQTYWIVAHNQKSTVSSDDSTGSLDDSECSFVDQGTGVHLKTRSKKPMPSPKRQRNSVAVSPDSRRAMLQNSNHSAQVWASKHAGESDDDDDCTSDFDGFEDDDSDRHERLIEWNVRILSELLRRILASRRSSNGRRGGRRPAVEEDSIAFESKQGQYPFDEITEIIPIGPGPSNAPSGHAGIVDYKRIQLSKEVEEQLTEYVTTVAFMYRENFFHNFEHASHVLMSAQKLLHRVIASSESNEEPAASGISSVIATDPLTCFAIVYASLVHDVDHTGVPNSQLINEKAHIAELYDYRSIAEQNSLDLSWNLLMSKDYHDLQRAIFANQAELDRFRQLVVNVILATDIFDKDMMEVRNSRWDKAFGDRSKYPELSEGELKSLKATIVIEHIMQASDVSHTMQHWQVYQKWNGLLFEEMYTAYQTNRLDKDPSVGWYQGEIWFFDNYVIPLAKKLKECEVFGSASDQLLMYAMENKKEWEAKGEAIVDQLVRKHSQAL